MTVDFFDVEPPEQRDELRDTLLAMIRDRDDATPRHQQRELGPSQVSHPCMRRLAYAMLDQPSCNPPFDPLPSIIGTSVHAWLDSAARHANNQLGRLRWMTETRVQVAEGLAGTSDLYDCDTGTVIDWKVVGTTRLRKYRKDPGPAYKGQVYLYGRGFENLGLPVNRVAIAFVPRGATLHSLHVWSADYDPSVADYVLARRDQTIALIDDLDVEHHPERFDWIPAEPYDCTFCPWYSTNPVLPLQCSGGGDGQ